jgi:hypothetical protein
MSDFAFQKLVLTDEIYFSKDYTLFSLIPLEGYRKWSDVLAHDFPGFHLDMTGGGRLANDVVPRLNFETMKKIFTMEANAECEEIANFERIVNEHGSVFLDEQGEVP